MRATVNGEAVELRGPKTIEALVVETLGSAERRGIAVARNGEIVRRDDWSQDVADGDEIEIVKAVQGGSR
jgi:sulfur carrier protein